MEEMPNACESIEKLAREAEALAILQIANECKTLEELKQRLIDRIGA